MTMYFYGEAIPWPETNMRGRPAQKKVEKHLFVSDFQIPEQDDLSIKAILKFIPDFKPDIIHFVGDILDLTQLSDYPKNPYDKHTLADEIKIAKGYLSQFCDIAKKANKDVVLKFHEGNHEERQLRYLSKNSPQFAELEEDGEYLLSLSHLLGLKKLGIEWHPYRREYIEKGNVSVEHGDVVRQHAGYTAKAMLDKRNTSGFSGHTHRLSLFMVTRSGNTQFWLETGSLCKLNWKHAWVNSPNWEQGFAIGVYTKDTHRMHPCVIPIHDHTFVYGGKVYAG